MFLGLHFAGKPQMSRGEIGVLRPNYEQKRAMLESLVATDPEFRGDTSAVAHGIVNCAATFRLGFVRGKAAVGGVRQLPSDAWMFAS
jgi:hypothetical protein